VDGWYNQPVAISFSGSDLMSGIDACTSTTYSGPDSGTASLQGTCADRAGNVSSPLGYGLKYDATKPVLNSVTPGRTADANGWYNQPVAFDIQADDATSGIASCPSLTYSGPDSGTASFTGSCRDRAGNTGTRAFGLKYDQTAPRATAATPDRAANGQGWYNAPVSVAFSGTDGTSGIEACTTRSYSGPDSGTASLGGTCRDRAGNTSAPLPFDLRYDATDPAVSKADPERPADSNGWYRQPVDIAFSGSDALSGVDSCTETTYNGPESGTASVAGTCRDRAGNVSAPFPFGLRYDATAPAVTKRDLVRPPDSNGWYNQPVAIALSGSDGLSGLDACTSTTYSGPDAANASVAGTCRDMAGNETGPISVPLKYDATAPQVTKATPDRAPDKDGWYNRPVTFAFEGTDATSGVAGCPDVTYDGPEGPAGAVLGQCSDIAGNLSSNPFALMFDATPPPIMDLAAMPADRSVALSWRTTDDAESVGVVRTPGMGPEPTSVVFTGPGTGFVDGQVENGVRYAYEVRVEDPAGNAHSETVSAVPEAPAAELSGGADEAIGASPASGGSETPAARRERPRLLAPAAGAVFPFGARPLLRWTPVPGADYYNLQLFRDGKILSTWPTRPRYRLELRWRSNGKRQRLVPGEYRWLVWPGFGPRAKVDYGRRIGRREFEIKPPRR
jgi:hypothetical protein